LDDKKEDSVKAVIDRRSIWLADLPSRQ